MKFTHLFLCTFILILLFSSLALADPGCFFYDSSPLHCQTVDEVTAREECSFFSSCLFPAVFFPGTSCEDTVSFPQCETILCKGTCSKEWAGECLQGKISPEEEPFWCSAGCCQFMSGNMNHCSYEISAGSCESAARNTDASQFKFNSAILESECISSCNGEVVGGGWVSKVVAPIEILAPPSVIREFSFVPQNITSESEISSTNNLLIWFLAIVIFAGLVGGTTYYIHLKRKKSVSTEKKSEVKTESQDPFSPFQSNPEVKEHIETIHHHLDHKKKEKERKEVLTVFAGLDVPYSQSSVDKLKKVVRRHKLTPSAPVESTSESAISKLKSFVNKK